MARERPSWGITRRRMKREIGFKCLLHPNIAHGHTHNSQETVGQKQTWHPCFFLLLLLLACCHTKLHSRDILIHSLAHLVYPLSLSLSLSPRAVLHFLFMSPVYFHYCLRLPIHSSWTPWLQPASGVKIWRATILARLHTLLARLNSIDLILNTSVFSRLTKEEPKNIPLTRAKFLSNVPQQGWSKVIGHELATAAFLFASSNSLRNSTPSIVGYRGRISHDPYAPCPKLPMMAQEGITCC